MNYRRIDLRSDTVTRPNAEMFKAMTESSLRDHRYNEDETTFELEKYCANLFQKEAALFMTSGTMSNQVPLRAAAMPGDEIVIERSYHINFFEAAPSGDIGKIALNPIRTNDGILRVNDIDEAINFKPRNSISAAVKMICIENTINAYGWKIFPLHEMKEIFKYAKRANIHVHLDGARLFNACVATGIHPSEYAKFTDSLCLCFSKGLGAPFGSILMGTRDFIPKAEAYRHWYGGSLHQCGPLAGAALYSIKNNIAHLEVDQKNASRMAKKLEDTGILKLSYPVETNIVMFNVSQTGVPVEHIIAEAVKRGVLLYPWSKTCIRAVTNNTVDEKGIDEAVKILLAIINGST